MRLFDGSLLQYIYIYIYYIYIYILQDNEVTVSLHTKMVVFFASCPLFLPSASEENPQEGPSCASPCAEGGAGPSATYG